MSEERDVRLALDDIVENLRLAREFCGDLSSAVELSRDSRSLYAIVRALEIAGEAAKRVPEEVRSRAPEVPWKAMSGMRDRLIHGYHDVDVDLVWRTATSAAPEAERILRDLLEQLDSES